MALATTSSATGVESVESYNSGGICVSGCGEGCLDFKASMVSSSRLAKQSSQQARRTAHLKSHSSSLVATRVSSVLRGSPLHLEWLHKRGWDGIGSASSLSCWFTSEAKLHL